MTTNCVDDATFDDQVAQLSRDCDAVIEEYLSRATDSRKDAYQVDLEAAKWIIEEVDRKETTTPKAWAVDNDLYVIFTVMGVGVIGLFLSLFSGMESVIAFINARSALLLMVVLPIVVWSFYSMAVIEVQKRIDTQTLELLWARWSALGLSLSLLTETIQYGNWKYAEREAEAKRYGLAPSDPNFRKLRRLQYEFQLKAALITRHDTQAVKDFWRYIDRFWKLEKMLKTE
jgi:hypothetical protein